MIAKTSIPAAGYVRMSTDEQADSPAQQKAQIKAYAERHGYRIVRWYVDEGISGDATDKRVQFLAMHTAATSSRRDFDVILCWDQDRFGRFNSLEAGYWVHPLVKAGVKLVTLNDGTIDWTDFTGRLMYGIKQEGKHQFLRDLSRNVTRGLVARAQEGRWPNGTPPRGYATDDDGRLIPGAAVEVKTIRRIFHLYLDGGSIRSVVRALGKGWNVSTVRYVLTNDLYAGDFRWGERGQGKYSRATEAVFLPNNHPALIDRKTFDAVQRRLADRKDGCSTPHQGGGGFLLTGLLQCGCCGSRMHGMHNGGPKYYLCGGYIHRQACDRNSVRQDVLVGKVLDALDATYTSPRTIERLRAELRRQVKRTTAKPNAERLARQVKTLDTKITKARRRLVEVDHDMVAIVQQQLRELDAERRNVEAELQAARMPQDAAEAEADRKVAEALETFTRLRQAVEGSDSSLARELLRQAVQSVDVDVAKRTTGRRSFYTLIGGRIHTRNLFSASR